MDPFLAFLLPWFLYRSGGQSHLLANFNHQCCSWWYSGTFRYRSKWKLNQDLRLILQYRQLLIVARHCT